MSDSLKEQLLKAGFKETEKASAKKKAPGKSHKSARNPSNLQNKKNHAPAATRHPGSKKGRTPSSNEPSQEEIAARKKIKAEIKALIDGNSVKDFKGEITFSYMLGKRVKQIFVNPEIHNKLAADELVITRLNGSTHIITPEIVDGILALNADWAIIRNVADSTGVSDEKDGYEEYKIPDDLRW